MWKPSVLGFAITALVAATAVAELKIGDPAPSVTFTEWIKGESADPAKGVGQNVFLVEFWATWCPPCIASIPHLTELQRKYRKDGLIIIGAAGPGRGETLRKVKRFVKKRGEAIDYTIGFDESGATHARYMGASGASGIPFAFLIDRKGNLVWRGHPGDPEMDDVLDRVMKGEFDVESARMRATLAPVFGRLQHYSRVGDWAAFTATVTQILAMDPKNPDAFAAMVFACMETGDVDSLKTVFEKHLAEHRDNADAMGTMADALLSIGPINMRQPELALRAAAAAFEAKKSDQWSIGTYARALFEIGMVERAIELQEQAMAAADGAEMRAGFERVLDYYKKCKALQSGRL